MAENEPTKNDDLMKEFAEFLEAKRASEKEEQESEDFDVEIWDEKGRGVRTKRSHAKPFLQSLGIDLDPDPKNDAVDDGKDGTKSKSGSPRKTPAKSESTVRKYFTAGPKK